MNFKELKEEILGELMGYHPITEAERFYVNYLTVEARVLREDYVEIFRKDLEGASKDPYVSYSFQVFLKRLISLISEKEKIG